MSNNSNEKYFPILGNGERLISAVTKNFPGGSPNYPRTFEEAKRRVIKQLKTVQEQVVLLTEENRMDEIVLTLRLNEKFLAKTYTPETFFRQSGFENIGSRRWKYSEEESTDNPTYSKLHFIKVDDMRLKDFYVSFESDSIPLTKSFENDVRKIEEISLLTTEEIIQGFDDEWEEGTVEFVLHPYKDNELMIEKFKRKLAKFGVEEDALKIRTYEGGPTFISAVVKKEVVENIADFNPLRSVHPLKIEFFPQFRGVEISERAIIPPKGEYVSSIKVGIFDGGIESRHPLLEKFSKENRSIGTKPNKEGIKHGTAVAGAVLYGDLSKYNKDEQLDDPKVFVESFQVLPLTDPSDLDLYEAIDFIENTVPSRHDIKVYNLSFGPVGPIIDDEISRFTYALDTLAWNYQKLFVVAVGNDGERPAPYNRIQAPADLVNGLGVGAYIHNYQTGKLERASYSCIGSGREGCKVKPDLCAFGGDRRYPMHLLNSDNFNGIWLNAGTSFAAPIVSSKAAELLGRCDQFSPLVARALLIHSAENPNKVDDELGYGVIKDDVEEILSCDANKVTIIYSNSMNPTGLAKLPIPLPLNANITTNVQLSWTIATVSKANALHVEDYTESAIEDTFYPHDKKYKFTKNGFKNYTLHVYENAELIDELIQEGYTQSSLPVSLSPIKYQTERAKRGEMKWDTVVKKWRNCRASTLENPFLVLHGLGRNGSTDRIDYAVIVTIEVPRYEGNLYEAILNEYRLLEPIAIRSRNEIMIKI